MNTGCSKLLSRTVAIPPRDRGIEPQKDEDPNSDAEVALEMYVRLTICDLMCCLAIIILQFLDIRSPFPTTWRTPLHILNKDLTLDVYHRVEFDLCSIQVIGVIISI